MQKLSKRLQAVADFITPGSRIADVGTDHAYLPIALVQQKIIPKALAMDVRPGPLECAKAHIQAAGLEAQIIPRLSDGVKELEPGEADSVVMAGMGGLLVIRILEQVIQQSLNLQELVLEPQSDIEKVRHFLREQEWCIDKEALVLEDGKYYPVLHVIPAKNAPSLPVELQTWLQNLEKHIPYEELRDRYPVLLAYEKSPELYGYLEREIRIQKKIKAALSDSEISEKTKRRKWEVQQRLEELELLLDLYREGA